MIQAYEHSADGNLGGQGSGDGVNTYKRMAGAKTLVRTRLLIRMAYRMNAENAIARRFSYERTHDQGERSSSLCVPIRRKVATKPSI